MAHGRILVTARSFRKLSGPHRELLEQAGYEIVEPEQDRPLEPSELAPLLADVDGAILGLDRVTAAALQDARCLKVISRFGVGVDEIDLQAATARGIVVTVTPGANSIAVAELTVALMLALKRHLRFHDQVVREGRWDRRMGSELAGEVLGLVGFGRIGREVARRARAFDMRILFTDPEPPPQTVAAELQAEPREFDDLLATSDIISLHLPLTQTTRGLIGERQLQQMKTSAVLVNTARGGLVDETALFHALQQGHIAGAAFDVFDREPPGDSPLLRLENFIGTPHIGSATQQSTLRMGLMAAENALLVLEGRRPAHVVNPEVYDRIHNRPRD